MKYRGHIARGPQAGLAVQVSNNRVVSGLAKPVAARRAAVPGLALAVALVLAACSGPRLPPVDVQAWLPQARPDPMPRMATASGNATGPGALAANAPGADHGQPARSAPVASALAAAPARRGADPDWWLEAGDAMLSVLVQDAQRASGDWAAAAARVSRARAVRRAAEAGAWPQLGAVAEGGRGRPDLINPMGTRHAIGLQASWELDLFGGVAAAAEAGRAREAVAAADQDAVAVALAAETATAYTGWQACEARRSLLTERLTSLQRSQALVASGVRAGLLPSQAAASAEHGVAAEQAGLAGEAARCESLLQALVALSARSEAGLRRALSGPPVAPRMPPVLSAQWLHQRPDLAAAAASVVAAAADERQALARSWPRITLGGSLSAAALSTADPMIGDRSGRVWSVGPLQVTLPLFDAGARRADQAAARQAYAAALVQYDDRLRQALREVRQALLQWQAATDASRSLHQALQVQQQQAEQARQRWQRGLANRLEADEAERALLSARLALLDQQAAGVQGWIGLYRALGGGWSASGAPA